MVVEIPLDGAGTGNGARSSGSSVLNAPGVAGYRAIDGEGAPSRDAAARISIRAGQRQRSRTGLVKTYMITLGTSVKRVSVPSLFLKAAWI